MNESLYHKLLEAFEYFVMSIYDKMGKPKENELWDIKQNLQNLYSLR